MTECMDSVPETIVEVRVHIRVVKGRQSVSAIENALDRPPACPDTPGGFGRPIVREPLVGIVSAPRPGEFDAGIRVDRLVPEEVRCQKDGHRSCHITGQVQQEVDLHASCKGKADLFPNRLAAECILEIQCFRSA